MSISNQLRFLLDIQDEHIYFEEDCKIKLKKFKGKKAKFITHEPTYTPSHFECCGIKNEIFTIGSA